MIKMEGVRHANVNCTIMVPKMQATLGPVLDREQWQSVNERGDLHTIEV